MNNEPEHRHPLYEIRERANKLETEIIECARGDTEALLEKVLTLTMLVRGLISVGIANWEMGEKK